MSQISIYDALRDMDIPNKQTAQGEYCEFGISYFKTTGNEAGTLKRKKLAKIHRPMKKSSGGFKGNNKRDRTLPLVDLAKDRPTKIKITAIQRYRGKLVFWPIRNKDGTTKMPFVKNGRLRYE